LPSSTRVVGLPSHPAATLAARESLLKSVRGWSPDVVYARHGLVHPGLVWTAARLPTVIEINSNDVTEFAATSPWRWRYARTTRDMMLARSSGLVFVTDELRRSVDFDKGPAQRVTVANGIRLDQFPSFERPSNPTPRLVFIGHPNSPWHGLEHVLELAVAFPTWAFDVIGPDAAELAGAPDNLVAHGVMVADEYDEILRSADVAIGTLGLYSKKMEEACPLKVREYLARGIPTIIGYIDTDFPEPAPFLLQVPNSKLGVSSSLDRIADFVDHAGDLGVPTASIQHLDVGAKEVKRLDFLESVASTPR